METQPDYLLNLYAVRKQCEAVFTCYGATIPCEREMDHEGRHFGHIVSDDIGDVSWGEFHSNTDEDIPF